MNGFNFTLTQVECRLTLANDERVMVAAVVVVFQSIRMVFKLRLETLNDGTRFIYDLIRI